jgi:hypothetical protein
MAAVHGLLPDLRWRRLNGDMWIGYVVMDARGARCCVPLRGEIDALSAPALGPELQTFTGSGITSLMDRRCPSRERYGWRTARTVAHALVASCRLKRVSGSPRS